MIFFYIFQDNTDLLLYHIQQKQVFLVFFPHTMVKTSLRA